MTEYYVGTSDEKLSLWAKKIRPLRRSLGASYIHFINEAGAYTEQNV
jgi:hypothetical protein